jgi:hypothetical protein
VAWERDVVNGVQDRGRKRWRHDRNKVMGVQALGGGGGGKADAQEGEVKRLERVDGKLRSRERICMVETRCTVVAQYSGGSCAGSKEDGEATSRSAASGVEGAATV